MADGAHKMELKSTDLGDDVTMWTLTCLDSDCEEKFHPLKGNMGHRTLSDAKRIHEKVTLTMAEIRRRNGG